MNARAISLIVILLLAPVSILIEPIEAGVSGRALACSGSVCLNEALPNPSGYDDATWPNGEWMEIHNSGSTAIDILNWELENKAGKILQFNSTTIVGFESGNSSTWTISPGEYMVIARNGYGNFYLTNSFDYITMTDASGNFKDQASWNSTSSGVSLEEDSANSMNDWIPTNTPTPGSANSQATGPVYTGVLFNEVMANPFFSEDNSSWPGGEWIELHNEGTSDVDLTGWTIVDNAGNNIPLNESHLIGNSNIIVAGGYRVIAVNSSNAWGVLNNGAESLRLTIANGSTTDQISWTDTVAGFSSEELADGSWFVTSYPSPGIENPNPWTNIVDMQSDVVITEVLANSSRDGFAYPEGEWVELHNTGNTDWDLADWKIRDGMGNLTHINIGNLVMNNSQPGTIIAADSRRLVQFSELVTLWNQYNHLMLEDPTGNVVYKAWWDSDPGLNNSLIEAQNPDLPWVIASWPTPENPEPGTTSIVGDIAFNEIFPDAIGNDTDVWPNGEWIELINTGTQSVDIANWYFSSGSRNFNINVIQLPEKDSTTINPGEIFVVAINGTQSFYLKNTAPDTIELRNSANQIVSTITYNKTTEGESLWYWNNDWTQAPYPTPNQPNPQTSPYAGEVSIEITEVLAHCSSDTITPLDDWIEVNNTGGQAIDLNAWRLISGDGDLIHARSDRLYNSINTLIQPADRKIITAPNWFISGLGDSVTLEDPDGNVVDSVVWTTVTDCKTMDSDGEVLPWPTPGYEEPDISSYAGPEDLVFSRFMFQESSASTNDEFFEITNIGNRTAVMTGWTVTKTTTSGQSFNGTFNSLFIDSGNSVIISPDASAVKAMEQSTIVNAEDVMDFPVWLPDSGSTIQLISPLGVVADTFVYGNGPTDLVGWSGPAISEPVTTVDRILYIRGDGCGNLVDTNQSADWEIRWSVAGASHFCGINSFSDNANVTPLIAPEAGLDNVVSMINDAQQSIHVHIYQLHHVNLAYALIQAQTRGVEVTVVIHEPENWWSQSEISQSRGIAYELENSGVDVLQFSSSSSSPYQYLHSKVTVVDDEVVWFGSGNWKSSSMPADNRGNRDWGIIIESSDLAQIVLERITFDEDPSQLHVEDSTFTQPASGSYESPIEYVPTNIKQPMLESVNGELLTCPDDCVQGLAELIQSAESEILLSLQYFEMDWYWGWQTNPLLESLEDAAERGITIRMAINQHYVNENPGIREAVNELNSWQGDVEAVLMSENETVRKLHNKGMIIDGEIVLVSSINWGDNSILRNREMGIAIENANIAAVYEQSFWEDWNRMDTYTDTDIDGIPDYWELENGLDRTMDDSGLDNDNDGITNHGEFTYGSDPNSNDSDGDCILDGDEVIWASQTTGVTASNALLLEDADLDGLKDSETLGCKPEIQGEIMDEDDDGVVDSEDDCPNTATGDQVNSDGCSPEQITQPVNNNDADEDGIPDDEDECPNTPPETATDTQGCSSEQNKEQSSDDSQGSNDSSGLNFMIILIVIGTIICGGALFVLLRNPTPQVDVLEGIDDDSKSYEMPVLDGTNEVENQGGIDMSKFPGWDTSQVERYLESGWTEEQLSEWYQQQIEENSA